MGSDNYGLLLFPTFHRTWPALAFCTVIATLGLFRTPYKFIRQDLIRFGCRFPLQQTPGTVTILSIHFMSTQSAQRWFIMVCGGYALYIHFLFEKSQGVFTVLFKIKALQQIYEEGVWANKASHLPLSMALCCLFSPHRIHQPSVIINYKENTATL